MIDVVFQLVVFFMVSSTFVMTPGIALDLPESTSSEPVVLNRLVVTVVSPAEVYLNRELLPLADLDGRLSEITIESDRVVIRDSCNHEFEQNFNQGAPLSAGYGKLLAR
jgi:biopolymer transport protein ExbD